MNTKHLTDEQISNGLTTYAPFTARNVVETLNEMRLPATIESVNYRLRSYVDYKFINIVPNTRPRQFTVDCDGLKGIINLGVMKASGDLKLRISLDGKTYAKTVSDKEICDAMPINKPFSIIELTDLIVKSGVVMSERNVYARIWGYQTHRLLVRVSERPGRWLCTEENYLAIVAFGETKRLNRESDRIKKSLIKPKVKVKLHSWGDRLQGTPGTTITMRAV